MERVNKPCKQHYFCSIDVFRHKSNNTTAYPILTSADRRVGHELALPVPVPP